MRQRRKWGRCGLRLRTIRCCGRRVRTGILNLGQSCGAAVPLSALLFGPDRSVVQTVRSDRVETHRVATDLIGDSNVEIREGLAEGDIVVLCASAFLRDGDRVRPAATAE